MTSDALSAETDVTTYHIEGIAREGNKPFSMPLITHIEGNLWQGGCIGGLTLPPEIEYVVSLYPWERYRLDPNRTKRIEYSLLDSPEVVGGDELDMLSRLVNARAHQGWPVADSIALLREKRSPAVLSNAAFEHWLQERWS